METNIGNIRKRFASGGARAFALAIALAVATGVGFELHGKALAQQAQTQLPSPQGTPG